MKIRCRTCLLYTPVAGGDAGLRRTSTAQSTCTSSAPGGRYQGLSSRDQIAVALVWALRPPDAEKSRDGRITLRPRAYSDTRRVTKRPSPRACGVETILIPPRGNRKDLEELPPSVRERLSIRLVDSMDEVLRIAFRGGIPQRPETLPLFPTPPVQAPAADYAH